MPKPPIFISGSGDLLSPIEKMRRLEGIPAEVYIHGPRYRHNYDGIIPKIPLSELKKKLYQADDIIFDMTRTNSWKKYLDKKKKDPKTTPSINAKTDLEFLKMFGLPVLDRSLFGALAQKLSKGARVVGCNLWAEDVEMDRSMGSELAKKIGLEIPEYHEFASLKDGTAFLREHQDDLWVLKPNENQDNDLTYVEKYEGELMYKFEKQLPARTGEKFSYILQKVVKGHEISSEAWWTGNEWCHYNHTIENKRTMNNNLGPAIGCQDSIVWVKDEPVNSNSLMVKAFAAYTPYVKRSGYIGPVDFNCIVTEDGKAYFLEFTHRHGYDATFCFFELLTSGIGNFYLNDFQGTFFDGFAGSQRITIPPFPEEDKEQLVKKALGVPIVNKLPLDWFWGGDIKVEDGQLMCAGADGILGVVTGRGKTLMTCVDEVYKNIHKLKVGAYLQYRTDLDVRARKVLSAFKKWNVEVG